MGIEINASYSSVTVSRGYVSAAAEENVEAETVAEGASKEKKTEQDSFEYRNKGANALDSETIKSMNEELEQRSQNLIRQMLGKQLDTLAEVDPEFWSKLRTGQFDVTPEQQEEARKAVADDGYWGVEQTSDRFIKYATALAGGDPDQLEKIIGGFQKGYAAAESLWGGQLPELCQRTYDATMEKFEKLKEQLGAGRDEE